MTILVLGDQRVTKNGLIGALMVNIRYPYFLGRDAYIKLAFKVLI